MPNSRITSLDGLRNLTDLDLSDNAVIGDDGISRLVTLCSLRLNNRSRITSDGVSGLTTLTALSFLETLFIDDRGIQGLTKLKSLEYGFRQGGKKVKITSAGVSKLVNLDYVYCAGRKLRYFATLADFRRFLESRMRAKK
jgi:Leucine-rich repeat (LRR) protein